MDVFHHHIYEYNKGLRNLVLYAASSSDRPEIEKKLSENGIDYLVANFGDGKINVFFGNRLCIEIVKSFGIRAMSELTDKQDFILGIMLGYDRLRQCERYLARRQCEEDVEPLIG